MRRTFISMFQRRGRAIEWLARWPGPVVLVLALGVLGALLLGDAGLHPSAGGTALLAAVSAWLAWWLVAAGRHRAALPVPPRIHGPLVWLDQAHAPTLRQPCADTSPLPPIAVEQLECTVWVVFASQTGFAEQVAQQTSQQLQRSGVVTRLQSLGTLQLADLHAARRLLFVVSTTGDGEAPDAALPFFRQYMGQLAELSGVSYGILALGDRDYDDFCGFGRKLERWLQSSGAQPLFDLVEVDSEEEAALRQWQYRLTGLGADADQPDWQPPRYQRWQLLERRRLNPGSVGAPCFGVALRPMQGRAYWEAGDLIEIGPGQPADAVTRWLNAQHMDGSVTVRAEREHMSLRALLARSRLPFAAEVDGLDADGVAAIVQRLPHRTYSIASLPDDGAVHLLVRQTRGSNGQPGLGSGWLTEHAAVGAEIAARIRNNVNFHVPEGRGRCC